MWGYRCTGLPHMALGLTGARRLIITPAPPVVVVPQQPQTYVQRNQRQESDYWYYCQNPQGYYPYIKSCPGGWMKVVPDTVPPGR